MIFPSACCRLATGMAPPLGIWMGGMAVPWSPKGADTAIGIAAIASVPEATSAVASFGNALPRHSINPQRSTQRQRLAIRSWLWATAPMAAMR